MSGVLIIAGFALRESVRRRVFVVVALLTVGFLVLYALGVWQIAKESDVEETFDGVDGEIVVAATMLGLSMFATLFLGAILAVFLTFSAVRGDAERGLLQPLLVRPLPRGTLLLGRFAAAAVVCVVYVIARLPRGGADHPPVHPLVAGPADPARAGAGGRGRRDRRVRARRVDRALQHRQRHRGLHALRRRAGRRAARADRGGRELEDAREGRADLVVGDAVRGALPDVAERRSRRTRAASRGWRSTLGPFGGAQSYGTLLWPYTAASISG